MRWILILGLLFTVSYAPAQNMKAKDQAEIESILERQTNCWNAGDLNGFMNGYWPSEELKFIGKTGITYGWQATLDRYKKSYPDRAAMGTLNFNLLHIESTGKKSALVIGKWYLTRPEAGDLEGHFSLTWRKIDGDWVIVADHSS